MPTSEAGIQEVPNLLGELGDTDGQDVARTNPEQQYGAVQAAGSLEASEDSEWTCPANFRNTACKASSTLSPADSGSQEPSGLGSTGVRCA
jgi:hypothetical protein